MSDLGDCSASYDRLYLDLPPHTLHLTIVYW